jgi:hypothetical protein
MSSNISFREPKVSGDVGGIKLRISGAQTTMTINEMPSLALSVHPQGVRSGDLVDLSSPDITKWLAQNQTQKFTDLTTVNVYQDSGSRNYLTTAGLLTTSAYEASKSSFEVHLALATNAAYLQALRTHIYRTEGNEAKDDDELLHATSMAEMFSLVLDRLIKKWIEKANARTVTMAKLDAKIMDQMHAINEQHKTKWQRLFSDSTATTKLPFMPDMTQDINEKIQDTIRQVFLTQGRDFFQQILTLCEMFNLLYIPDVGGTDAPYGRLISKDAVMGETAPGIISATHFTSRLGAYDVVPLAAVVVVGQGTENVKESGSDKGMPTAPVYATWPNPLPEKSNGRFEQIPLPVWLPAIYGPLDMDDAVKEANAMGLDANEYMRTKHKPRKDSMDKQQTAQRSILAWWARLAYLDIALGRDTLSLDIPFDFRAQLGYRYAVTDRNKKKMFTGFLAHIAHSVVVGEDSEKSATGDATTSLVFTHVECEGFVLPNKGAPFNALPKPPEIAKE